MRKANNSKHNRPWRNHSNHTQHPKKSHCAHFPQVESRKGTQAERFLVLHMETVNGKARSSEEIKASMAQTYTMPMDFNDMTDRIERYNGANGIIFSPASLSEKNYNPRQRSSGPQNPNQSLRQHGRRVLHKNHVHVGHQSQSMAPRMHGTRKQRRGQRQSDQLQTTDHSNSTQRFQN